MKLVVATSSYPRYPGDPAGGFVAEHVDWLRRGGHEVVVVAAGDEDAVPQPGVERAPAPKGLFYAGGAPDALRAAPWRAGGALPFAVAMARRLRAHRDADGVIAHWLPIAAVAACVLPGVPLTAVAHSGGVDLLHRAHLLTPAIAALAARRAQLRFVAHHLRARVEAAVPSALTSVVRSAQVVPMGIDTGRFTSLTQVERRRRIVFLGRLVAIKGIDVLIAALPDLVGDAEVVIAGDGPMRAEVERAASEHGAMYLGSVGGRERDQLLASATIVVLPSVADGDRREGFPVTALEAMAAGAAVVASRTGGLAELPASVAMMVAPGCHRSLVEACGALLADEAKRALMTSAGSRFAAARSWDALGRHFIP